MFRLFSHKMTHDSGFAPNPFWGELTLATCKPQIRLYENPGDWIAGFTSGELCGDRIGQEKLVYLMKVEQKLSIAQYFSRPRYENKIPNPQRPLHVHRVGDNIYRPLPPDGAFEQLFNCASVKSRNPAAGVFDVFEKRLQLTDEAGTRPGQWRLPAWCYPNAGKPPLSYHADLARWNRTEKSTGLRVVDRGQEFVLDCEHYPQATAWLCEILDTKAVGK